MKQHCNYDLFTMPLPRPAARNSSREYYNDTKQGQIMQSKRRLTPQEETHVKEFIGCKARKRMCNLSYGGDLDDFVRRLQDFPRAFYRNQSERHPEFFCEFVSRSGNIENVRGGEELLLLFLCVEAMTRMRCQAEQQEQEEQEEQEPSPPGGHCTETSSAGRKAHLGEAFRVVASAFPLDSDTDTSTHGRKHVSCSDPPPYGCIDAVASYVASKKGYDECVLLLGDVVRHAFECVTPTDEPSPEPSILKVKYSGAAINHMVNKMKVHMHGVQESDAEQLLKDVLREMTFSNVTVIARAALTYYCYGVPYAPKNMDNAVVKALKRTNMETNMDKQPKHDHHHQQSMWRFVSSGVHEVKPLPETLPQPSPQPLPETLPETLPQSLPELMTVDEAPEPAPMDNSTEKQEEAKTEATLDPLIAFRMPFVSKRLFIAV